MSKNNPPNRLFEEPETEAEINPTEGFLRGRFSLCEGGEKTPWQSAAFGRPEWPSLVGFYSARGTTYGENWADSVPELVRNLAALVAERKKQEIRFNVFQIAFDAFEKRLHRLESIQTKIIPIDTFLPEPYIVIRTILASVYSIEGGFQAGWFDANIYATGCNEEEAVRNLKGMVLDVFESFSEEPSESLGPEPRRQLAILKEYIREDA